MEATNSDSNAGDPEPGRFAERLLGIIDEGRRTATYKLALLIGLIDCCAEGSSEVGAAPQELRTRDLAQRVASLYWPQLRPFPSASGAVDLRQITNKQSTIVSVLKRLFDELPGVSSWEAAVMAEPDFAAQTLDVVELTVARFPLVRLQTVDGVPQPVLYELDWDENITLPRLRAIGGVVRLLPSAGDLLLRFAPLVRPLVELHWVQMVASLNGLDLVDDDLRRHLFGAERAAFPRALRQGLVSLQDGCFYCEEPLRDGSNAIDHFVPWARWPNDAIENLVVAHAGCNRHKSNRIPGPDPLARWAERLASRAGELAGLAARTSWPTRPERTLALARSMYGHLAAGSPVWNGPEVVVPAQPGELVRLLEAL